MIENNFKRLRCPNCGRLFKNKDRVFLDILNGLLHQRCYTMETLTIKDRGTYREIIEKYDFFHEFV